jgi:rod shape determining protein RodA
MQQEKVKMINKRYLRHFDWLNLTLTIAIVSIGLLFVMSTTYKPEQPFSLFAKKQLFGIVSGFVLYAICCIKDIRTLSRWGYYGYFATLFLLVYTIIGGWIGMGAQRWISLYVFRFQPSELAKLCFPFFTAAHIYELGISRNLPHNRYTLKPFLMPLFGLAISFILIAKQPDLGTALMILFSGITLLWLIGLPRKFFIITGLLALIASPFFWNILKPYQQQRVLVLFGYGTTNNERYQIEQSKIAIGSGGLTGKGLLRGTQNRLKFLPENHNDFIYSILCEEWGFVGAILVLLLYVILFFRFLSITIHFPSLFEQTIAIGLIVQLMFSVFINISMVIGLLPTVGTSLPLFSYGITNLWITMISLGILNNIAIRRHYY